VADQKDPVAQRKEAKVHAKQNKLAGTTLRQAYEAYKQTRDLKPKTLQDYDRVMTVTLKEWLDLPLTKLSSDMVVARHKQLPSAYGNLTMRVLKAVMNYAMESYVLADGTYLIPRNPVAILGKTKAWKRVAPRTNYIKPNQLAAWFKALEVESNQTIRDYLLFVLFTGLRRENAASLTWAQVDLEHRSYTVTPKMHNAVTLPLSDNIAQMRAHSRFSDRGKMMGHQGRRF
jgi:integrase